MKKLTAGACWLLLSPATVGAVPAQRATVRPAAASVSAAAEALSRGDTLEALTRADEALRADPNNAWAHYNRAAALAALERIDDAVAAYDQAAAAFAAREVRGRSLALWGKAHVLSRVGRCKEASQAFGDYVRVIGSSDPQSTTLASERVSRCHPADGAPGSTTAKPGEPSTNSESKSGLPSLTTP